MDVSVRIFRSDLLSDDQVCICGLENAKNYYIWHEMISTHDSFLDEHLFGWDVCDIMKIEEDDFNGIMIYKLTLDQLKQFENLYHNNRWPSMEDTFSMYYDMVKSGEYVAYIGME